MRGLFGTCPAWSCGPSTSPLEAMTGCAAVGVVVLVLAAGLIWVLVPPFPSPETLLGKPLGALATQFGPAREVASQTPAAARWGKAVAWEKSRGVAVWTLEADWRKTPEGDSARPDMVSRCLKPRSGDRIGWEWFCSCPARPSPWRR